MLHESKNVGEAILGEDLVDSLPCPDRGFFRTGEHHGLVAPDRRIPVLFPHQREGQIGRVPHGEVCALTGEWRHQVGRISQQRDAGPVFPPVADRQGIDLSGRDAVITAKDELPVV